MPYQQTHSTLDVAFSRIFLFSKIFLVFPLNYSSGRFTYCKLRCFLSLLKCCFLVVTTILAVFVYHTPVLEPFPLWLFRGQFIALCIVVSTSVFSLLFSKERLNSSYRQIDLADAHFSTCGLFFDNRISYTYSYVYFSTHVLFFVADLFTYGDGILRTLYYYWCYCLLHSIDFHITGLLELLCIRFRTLTSEMKNENFKKFRAMKVLGSMTKGVEVLATVAFRINQLASIQFLFICMGCFVQILVNLYIISAALKNENDLLYISGIIVQLFWIWVAISLIFRITSRTSFIGTEVSTFNLSIVASIKTTILSTSSSYINMS